MATNLNYLQENKLTAGRFTEMKSEYSKYYQDNLSEAQEFQDYCALQIMEKLHIPLVNMQSKEYQFGIGENLQGFEIKYDKIFKNTGNLWIEIAERISTNKQYVSSGIFRGDNSWLYCIGDYETIYIFSKKHLQLMANNTKWNAIENKMQTSKGFLLTQKEAEKYSVNKIITKLKIN
jgi:hypothetical protein